MRRLTPQELSDKALFALSDNPKIDKVFATSDGNVFLKEVFAKRYAKVKRLKVQTFERKKPVKPIIKKKNGNS